MLFTALFDVATERVPKFFGNSGRTESSPWGLSAAGRMKFSICASLRCLERADCGNIEIEGWAMELE